MGKYVDQLALEHALSPKTVIALFDDDNSGAANPDAVADLVDMAEAEVDSWLVGIYDPLRLIPFDRLLRRAALDYLIAFSFERHPEYVRTFGEDKRTSIPWKRADARMERIRDGMQRLPDQPDPDNDPKNSGGIIYDSGPRVMIDSADGTQNGNGF